MSAWALHEKRYLHMCCWCEYSCAVSVILPVNALYNFAFRLQLLYADAREPWHQQCRYCPNFCSYGASAYLLSSAPLSFMAQVTILYTSSIKLRYQLGQYCELAYVWLQDDSVSKRVWCTRAVNVGLCDINVLLGHNSMLIDAYIGTEKNNYYKVMQLINYILREIIKCVKNLLKMLLTNFTIVPSPLAIWITFWQCMHDLLAKSFVT